MREWLTKRAVAAQQEEQAAAAAAALVQQQLAAARLAGEDPSAGEVGWSTPVEPDNWADFTINPNICWGAGEASEVGHQAKGKEMTHNAKHTTNVHRSRHVRNATVPLGALGTLGVKVVSLASFSSCVGCLDGGASRVPFTPCAGICLCLYASGLARQARG
jgi:type II secretory pathway pseudopilin PulG